MARVLGLGGLFMKARDKAALNAWYRDVLGIELSDWGGMFTPDAMAAHPGALTVFSFFAADTDYFAPSTKDFMINFAVDDLAGMIEQCRAKGVIPIKMVDDEN